MKVAGLEIMNSSVILGIGMGVLSSLLFTRVFTKRIIDPTKADVSAVLNLPHISSDSNRKRKKNIDAIIKYIHLHNII